MRIFDIPNRVLQETVAEIF